MSNESMWGVYKKDVVIATVYSKTFAEVFREVLLDEVPASEAHTITIKKVNSNECQAN